MQGAGHQDSMNPPPLQNLQIAGIAHASRRYQRPVRRQSPDAVEEVQIGTVETADPVQSHDDHPLRPTLRLRQEAGAAFQRPVEKIQRQYPITCRHSLQPIHRRERLAADDRDDAIQRRLTRLGQPPIQPKDDIRKRSPQRCDEFVLTPQTHESIQIGDIKGIEPVQIPEGFNHRAGIGIGTEGTAERTVILTPPFDGVNDAPLHEIEYGNDLH